MFRAYFDRSELAKPAPVMAVTGYLSSDEEWEKLEFAWRKVLDRFKVEIFHMTDYETRQRSFASWSNELRTDFIGQLIDLVNRHAIVAVGVGILMDDYGALSEDDRNRLGHPYVMCGLKAVADTLRWIDAFIAKKVTTGEWSATDKAKDVGVAFVFESGDEGAGELGEALKKEQRTGTYAGRILAWHFENKRGIGALQAADFAAYETTKQLVRTIGAEERAMRKSMDRLVSNQPYVAEYFDRRTLGELVDRVRRDANG
jgi:hypothetical protein